MDHPLIDLISAKIRTAESEGAFDDLPGAGKPLPVTADSDHLTRVMRENGVVPEFVSLSNEIAELRATLRDTTDRSVRKELMAKIADLEPRLAIARDAWTK